MMLDPEAGTGPSRSWESPENTPRRGLRGYWASMSLIDMGQKDYPGQRRSARLARRASVTVLLLGAALLPTACANSSAQTTNPTPPLTKNARLAEANPVTVSPLPGTEDASPTTQISFLGSGALTITGVHVVGSHTGAHSGQLEAYSTGTGSSFLPQGAFSPGEHVTVSATVNGAPVKTDFTIAHQASVSQVEFPDNPGNASQVQHYASAPTLTPSTVTITTPAKPGATPGDFFLAPYQGQGSPGPMIVDQAGNLIWFHPLPAGDSATNFRVQQYNGQPVLSWWQGRIIAVGYGEGEDVLYNNAYQQVAVISAGNGYHADLHEFRLEPDGTAWIDIFDPIDYNLSSRHGASDGILLDSVVEQIDVKTGLVMWEWHALGHIPIGDSQAPVPKTRSPYDWVHINTVDPGTSGDVLLSSRSQWSVYDVNLHTGAFNWEIGPHGTLKQGPGAQFYWQHDVEWQPGGLISMFDNGSTPPKEKQSRGLILKPNLSAHTVSLVKAYVNPTKTLLASSQGNLLSLPGGNWLMGYGGLPNFTEYDAAGHVLFDATLGKNVQDFRTYQGTWQGQPTTPPAIAVAPSGGGLTVKASWNGATQVASWQVLAGPAGGLVPVATAAKSGFETTIHLASGAAQVQVRALDASGAVLGTSGVAAG